MKNLSELFDMFYDEVFPNVHEEEMISELDKRLGEGHDKILIVNNKFEGFIKSKEIVKCFCNLNDQYESTLTYQSNGKISGSFTQIDPNLLGENYVKYEVNEKETIVVEMIDLIYFISEFENYFALFN